MIEKVSVLLVQGGFVIHQPVGSTDGFDAVGTWLVSPFPTFRRG